MEKDFRKILNIIDRLTEGHGPDLYTPAEELQQLCDRAGIEPEKIGVLLSSGYGKSQLGLGATQGAGPGVVVGGPGVVVSVVAPDVVVVAASGKIPDMLRSSFPGAAITHRIDAHQQDALDLISGRPVQRVRVHVRATEQQAGIWRALARVPAGRLVSYGQLAKATGNSAQDVRAAMAANPVAMVIPCHRVIKSTGELGHYHWGARRKRAIIIREGAEVLARIEAGGGSKVVAQEQL